VRYYLIIFFFLTCNLTVNAQLSDIEATLKYPDELVFDKSLMSHTVYKPNTSIACRYEMRQVSKTLQRTVFMSEGDSVKMSFAFFDLQKLPFHNNSDTAFESARKFYIWDSSARATANMPAVSVVSTDKTKGILYYREMSGDKTKLYLVGAKNNLISLILFTSKDLDPDAHMGNMEMSFKLNSRE
jgi:hypothetical protein